MIEEPGICPRTAPNASTPGTADLTRATNDLGYAPQPRPLPPPVMEFAMQNLMKALVLAAGIGLASPALLAEPMAPPKADLTAVSAGVYKLDPGHTNVMFRLSHLGFSGYMGRFDKISGTLDLDPKAPTKSKLDISIEATSVDVNNAKLEEELRDKDAFNVAEFPAITFKSTKLEQKDPTHGEVTGDLTFLGVTKPVTLAVTLNGAGPYPMGQKTGVGFSATATIKRSDFGMKKWLPMVGDDVQLYIETEFQQGS
ncbi:MAG: YceI family protein [Alphaproteobacteria bacterium]